MGSLEGVCRGRERRHPADCRVAFGALVAPAAGYSDIENISVADAGLICAGYEVDQFQHRLLIPNSSTTDPQRIHDRSQLHPQETPMSRLKVIHGVSRIRRAKLQSSIDQTVADDIELLAQWSNNEANYVINELLRFALAQEEDFQKYKAAAAPNSAQSASNPKPASAPLRAAADAATKPNPTATATAVRE
jgi:hypothetical protein